MDDNGWKHRRCRVMYVQDSAPEIRLVKEALEVEEHRDVAFIGVSDAAEARRALEHLQPPNLILLGWRPGQDTITLVGDVKNGGNLDVIPILVLGHDMRPEDVQNLYDQQVSCVIETPDSFGELQRTLAIIKEFWLNHARLP